MGEYVDSLKFAGGSFSLMPRPVLIEFLKLCHDHDVLVSTGGFLEYVLTKGPDSVGKYIEECKQVGFDIIEISCGFVTIPADDWLRLIEKVRNAGLKPKPEIGIQFGAGGATRVGRSRGCGTRDPEWPIRLAQRFLTYDFLRMAAISGANIKLAGTHVGVSIREDGPSQMALEDIALMCAEPNYTVLYPSDATAAWRLRLNSPFNTTSPAIHVWPRLRHRSFTAQTNNLR